MHIKNLELLDPPDEVKIVTSAVVIFEWIDDDGELRIAYVKPAEQANTVTIGMTQRILNHFMAQDLKGWLGEDDLGEDDDEDAS